MIAIINAVVVFTRVAMKEIVLNTGSVVVVDEEDYELVNQWRWQEKRDRNARTSYAIRVVRTDKTPCGMSSLYMHRIILAAETGTEVDHINSNGLDNRRCNLRLCSHRENTFNRRVQRNRQFTGVYRRTSGGYAAIFAGGQLGTFATKEEAARAWDRACARHRGEFARLNLGDTPDTEHPRAVVRASTGYRGVYPVKSGFMVVCAAKYIGFFSDPVTAARVYDAAAMRRWGQSYKCNFPEEHTKSLSPVG